MTLEVVEFLCPLVVRGRGEVLLGEWGEKLPMEKPVLRLFFLWELTSGKESSLPPTPVLHT